MDESGCDGLIGFRRTGWAPLGVTPVQVAPCGRGERHHMLVSYAQDGIVYAQLTQGSTNSDVFENYIRELLKYCRPYPEPKSVLIMDNASFHHAQEIKQLCDAAGVRLEFLAPYFPQDNPIEEYFAELKAYIKLKWHLYEQGEILGFEEYLKWCIHVVGSNVSHAEALP